MTKQRRTFTQEFKREAACLVLDQGYSLAEAALSLGLVESPTRTAINVGNPMPNGWLCAVA